MMIESEVNMDLYWGAGHATEQEVRKWAARRGVALGKLKDGCSEIELVALGPNLELYGPRGEGDDKWAYLLDRETREEVGRAIYHVFDSGYSLCLQEEEVYGEIRW
jgi:hypothetical protein